jgi:putative transcriptional regulator
MSPRHHPIDETLMAYAAGTLSAGPRLVTAIHLDSCPRCRDSVRTFEAVGGALLEEIEPEAVPSGALDALFARIDREPFGAAPGIRPAGASAKSPVATPDGIALPRRLAVHDVGRWRRLGPALSWARVAVSGAPDANVVMLRIPATRSAPRHGHKGREFTQVLVGGFSDGRDAYEAGDFIEVDDHVDHQPVVDGDGDCICIAAVEGRLLIHGIGRLLQPFIGL